jgi:hypothetical protein
MTWYCAPFGVAHMPPPSPPRRLPPDAESTNDLRVSERIADRAVAEVVELRQRLDEAATAERIVRDEAAGLRAELDARRTCGLRRRLRWALGRKR